ncbi:MAG: indolepyruvate ferredoxin oxidoreductase family protein [Sphingobium sp.]
MATTLKDVRLEDRFESRSGPVLLTGTQALIRMAMLQRELDGAAGLDTACYISGYRGSPLGALDQQLAQSKRYLAPSSIVFNPGINEELAATAVWGSQQAEMRGQGARDGVFAMWYGKGPGVDRSGDIFRHGNLAGSSRHGGVLLLLGDDHTCESSTTCHQSEYAMVDAMVPVLNPSGVAEIIDFGLAGWALSRFSGCWVALKCVHDTVSATATVELAPDRYRFVAPDGLDLPADGLNIRAGDTPRAQEVRLHRFKLKAAQAWARANGLDRVVLDSKTPRLCVVTTGKSYLDVVQALADLSIDAARADQLGLRVYKVGMSWPLEPEGAQAAIAGVDQVLVVEEKRGLIEGQLKELLFNLPDRPVIVGKQDEAGHTLLRSELDLQANEIAEAIGLRRAALSGDAGLAEAVRRRSAGRALAAPSTSPLHRTPYFCAGCPHNSSTKLPEGSRGMAGIGCAWMSQFMDRSVDGYTQMGGEGVSWVGEAPFSRTSHVFQNLGDGTYYHSGSLAIRAAVAAGTNITYKILYNDAVAMTGGQPHDGPLTPWAISRQVAAEGVARIVVVTDEPDKYGPEVVWAEGTTIRHRADLEAVQRELRDTPGVTALIYDQTCAAEKRRRRKRGTFPDPARRLFINEAVCEGCGDCGVASNCTALIPVETPLGRKRGIDQSSCNKDYACVDGFCPSFVSVIGGKPRRASVGLSKGADDLPEPILPRLDDGYAIIACGVGGTGIVTISAILAMAAHLEGKGSATLDMTGMAQKGGAVVSHVRLAPTQEAISAVRIAADAAQLMIGCDLVVAASEEALPVLNRATGQAIINDHQVMTGEFTRHRDLAFPADALLDVMAGRVAQERMEVIPATTLAERLFGDAMATNLLMLGVAWQRGLIPLSADAIERAVTLNGAAVAMNIAAFRAGRRLVAYPESIWEAAGLDRAPGDTSLAAILAPRERLLAAYQNLGYAARYRALVDRVAEAEQAALPQSTRITEAVARNYARVLAYKDEYEVARLYSDGTFARALAGAFEGKVTLKLHLAPPLLARRDPTTGHPRKMAFGGWMLRLFPLLAKMKGLRGTAFDPFGHSTERKAERAMIAAYEDTVAHLIAGKLDRDPELAVALASWPDQVRGFGHVKEAAMQAAARERDALLARWADLSR